MTLLKNLTTLLLGLIYFSPTQAQEYRFTYTELLKYTRYNAQEKYSDAQVGIFFMQDGQFCSMSKGWMTHKEHYETLSMNDRNELVLPMDEGLRQVNPLIFVQFPQNSQCNIVISVMARMPKTEEITYEQASRMAEHMHGILIDMSGYFSKWFIPDIQGIIIEYADDTKKGELVRTQLLLTSFKENAYRLPPNVNRILPWLNK